MITAQMVLGFVFGMSQLFRKQVFEYRQHRLSGVVSLVQPPVFRLLTLLLLAMVVVAVVFLSVSQYSRKETVIGVLQPDTGMVRLNAPQQGLVTQVLVEEGQSVEKGQPLVLIRSEKHGIKGFELNQTLINQYQFQLDSLTQQLKQQTTKQTLEAQALAQRHESLLAQRQELQRQSDIFTERLALNRQISQQVDKLAGTGYVSDIDLKKQQDTVMSLNQQASGINAQLLTVNLNIEQIASEKAQLPLVHATANQQLNTQIQQVNTQLGAIQQQQLAELRAPITGVVTGVLAYVGKGVDSNERVLSILPQDSVMEAVLYVPTSAFGFIELGQQVRLRYHAFPYQRFGIQYGEISQISANVILPSEAELPGIIQVPSYRVVVALNQQQIKAYGRQLPLRSGMKLDADIVIEQRSLIRWLFDPIFSLQG